MAELCIIEKWAENLDEATVSAWLVAVGDDVEAGDSLCEIITDKATFEYEIERAGTVRAIYCSPRSTVPVGYVIAFIGGPDEEPPPDIEAENAALMDEYRASGEAELDLDFDLDLPVKIGGRSGRRGGRPRATPAARRLAREHDLSIEQVAEELGVRGVVGEDDVRRYLDV